MLPRPFARLLIFCGIFILGLTALLSYARRDDPRSGWILYTTTRLNGTMGRELHAVLPDGTYPRWLMTISKDNSLIEAWFRPGWVTVQTSGSSNNRFSLVHLNGRSQALLEFGNGYVSPFGVTRDGRGAYLYLGSFNDPDAPLEIWQADIATGEHHQLDLPITQFDRRYRLDDSTFIIWSGHASGGDFYRVNFDNPTQLTSITTRGDISDRQPPPFLNDWLYFYTNSNPTALYRIRPDGSDEQLIAEGVVLGGDSISEGVIVADELTDYWVPSRQKVYFWTGDSAEPTLMETNPDGGAPRPIPDAPQNIWIVSWSPDERWVYFLYALDEFSPPSLPMLYRFNLATGEQQEVFENFNSGLIWTADGEWFYWVDGSVLYRARPDGSAAEPMMENLHSAYLQTIDRANLAAFATYESRGGYKIYTLDLRTQEISHVPSPIPSYRGHNVVGSVPSPAYEWAHGEQLAIGGIVSISLGGIVLVPIRKISPNKVLKRLALKLRIDS